MFLSSDISRRSHRIMSSAEVEAICRYMNSKWDKWGSVRRGSCIIFRLATCCGLRRKEILGLKISDLITEGSKPVVVVPAGITKGAKGKFRQSRAIPLRWSPATRDYLDEWKKDRLYESGPDSLCIRSYSIQSRGGPINGDTANQRFKAMVRAVLGPSRASQISLHDGRHTFVTHSLYAGRPIHEVAAAAGHSSISTTQIYAHLLTEMEDREMPPVFSF